MVSTLHYTLYTISLFLSFVHSTVWLATGPQPFPKRILHRVRFTVSSPFLKVIEQLLTSSSSSSRHFSFSPLPYFRWQSLRQLWPIPLPFLLFTVLGYSFPPWHCVILILFSTRLIQLILSIPLQHNISLSWWFWCTFRGVHFSAPYRSVLYQNTGFCFNFRALTVSWQSS